MLISDSPVYIILTGALMIGHLPGNCLFDSLIV